MQPIHPSPNAAVPANDANGAQASRPAALAAAPLWRVLATSGYGLWAWLGLALALGHQEGRSGTLIPLAVGLVLASFGLLLAYLPGWGATRDWYGWQPRRDSRPTRAALLAFATYLPMLAVAGLARGDNDFWATRVAGAVLALCSVASLAYNNYSHRRRWLRSSPLSGQLPLKRLLHAAYAGGLWLWVCTLAQTPPPDSPFVEYPWRFLLLGLAALLWLLETLSWRSLRLQQAERTRALRRDRWLAVLPGYVVPALALLLSASLPSAAIAVPSCLLGRWLEQRQFAAARGNDIIR